jgi:hypothetical protein
MLIADEDGRAGTARGMLAESMGVGRVVLAVFGSVADAGGAIS